MDTPTFGAQLREWRQRRRLSQQALAELAELSTRHLSFLETGRAAPSREMVLRLTDRLSVPLRNRNPMLEAAGYAPLFRQRRLDAPEMQAARRSIDLLLERVMPYPALAFDRNYDVVAANPAVSLLLEGIAPSLLQPPINAVRVSLHPDAMASRIVNFAQWRGHILDRLRRQWEQTGDDALGELLREVSTYPRPPDGPECGTAHDPAGVVLPLQLRTPAGVMSFISVVSVFGTPHDILLQELAIESFFPADDFTGRALASLAREAP